MSKQSPDIKYLFEPRHVAVIGASQNPAKIGSKILQNIISSGYRGEIYPVNPKGGEVLGRTALRSLEEIPGELDVVLTCVPAQHVQSAVEGAAKAGAKFNLVITSGFSEVGNLAAERKLTEYALEHGMRIIGPNIFGMYSSAASIDMTFGPGGIVPGHVAIITQSGALGLAMIGKTAAENLGLSALVSVGNKADIGETELLEYLEHDPRTKSIMLYIEGVREGAAMLKVMQRVAKKKPVVVIKSGRSQRGAAAAASHTGSLAGSDDVFDALLRQCGVMRAESIKEGFNLCKYLSATEVRDTRQAVIITNGGGIGVLATDACEKYNIPLLDDADGLHRIFSPVTPDFGSTKNPIDLTGGATSGDYTHALNAALEDEEIGSVIALYCETAVFDAENLGPMIKENYTRYAAAGKPIVFSAFGGRSVEESLDGLVKDGVPIFDDVYEAVHGLGGAIAQYRNRSQPQLEPEEASIDLARIEEIVAEARADGRSFLLAHEGQAVMAAAGLKMPRSRIARSLNEAVAIAEEIGFPVVMKVVSKDILHKSDSGGVALDLEDREEVIDAYQAIMRSCRSAVPGAVITGIEVSQMVEKGLELIVGARRDPGFGPIVMFGLGGIYVEVMKDVSFRAVPMNRVEAHSMIKEIRAYPLLLGVRGEDPKDMQSLIDAVIRLATIIRQCESISDIEINPIIVYEAGEGSVAVDARILLSKVEGGKSDE